jgi:hypothetical protein
MRPASIAVFAGLLAWPAAAQVVTGRTLDSATREIVPATLISLLNIAGDSLHAMLSDGDGLFRLSVPGAGSYALRAQRLGYADLTTTQFLVRPDEIVTVEVLLGADPIDLEPLAVVGRRSGSGLIAGHRRRADWIDRTGIGKVITRKEFDEKRHPVVTDYFQSVPGVRVVGSGASARVNMRGCSPMVFVDGVRAPGFDVNMINPDALEGVEIYRSVSEVPAELRVGGGCGAIALFTRPGEVRSGEWTLLQKIFASVAGSALTVFLLLQF